MKPDLAPYASGQHKPPSARQTEALRIIVAYVAEHGHAPTSRELGAAMGVTKGGASEHIERLERKGLVTRPQSGVARALRVTSLGRAFLEARQGKGGAS